MLKLALVGKSIKHSRSPELYRKLISPNIKYDLLDYDGAYEIPSAQELLAEYDGINITSPYKKHFLEQVELTASAKKTGAINCLRKRNGHLEGDNTDYRAIVDILNDFQKSHEKLEVILLGDGVMSKVTQIALDELGLPWKIFSRKLTEDFGQLNLELHFTEKLVTPLIINTCAREFVFKGKMPSSAIFWDFNYSFEEHSLTLPAKITLYLDGFSMLEKQAQYAVSFWSGTGELTSQKS